MVQKNNASYLQEMVRNASESLLLVKKLAEKKNVQICLLLLVTATVRISYQDVYTTERDVYLKVMLAAHIRELNQFVQDLREVMEPNIVGEPVKQLQELVQIENAQIKQLQQMLNVKLSYHLFLQLLDNYVLLMVPNVQIMTKNVHSLGELMKHAKNSQLLMVHAKQVLFQHLLLLVLLKFVMKLLTHLQQINNVQIIIQIVKLQVEDVRIVLDVEITLLKLHAQQIHHVNGQDNAELNHLHVVH